MHAADIYKIWKNKGAKGIKSLQSPLYLQTPRLQANTYQDIADFLISFFSDHHWHWRDNNGNLKKGNHFFFAAIRIIIDIILLPFILLYHHLILLQYNVKISSYETCNNSKYSPLYIRADHIFDLKAGGSVAHISGVINALRKLNFAPYILSTDWLKNVETDDKFYVIEPKYHIGRNIPLIPFLTYNSQLIKWWKKNRKNISFVYARYSIGHYASWIIAYMEKCPYICEYNGSNIWIARHWGGKALYFEKLLLKIENFNLQKADVIIVVSEASKNELLARNIDKNKILVNPNGVDTDIYHPQVNGCHIRTSFNISEKDVVIGFIGTFGAWHGVEILAKAFCIAQQHQNNKTNIHLMLIGDGERMQHVKEIIKDQQQVHLTGIINQEKAIEYLAACDILASPHVPNPDGSPFFGSPTKLFEYMAMGKAIIASKIDQIDDILEHNKTAYMVEPNNSAELAKCLIILTKDKEKCIFLGKNARSLCLKKHTWKMHTKRILEQGEKKYV